MTPSGLQRYLKTTGDVTFCHFISDNPCLMTTPQFETKPEAQTNFSVTGMSCLKFANEPIVLVICKDVTLFRKAMGGMLEMLARWQ